MHIVQPVFVAMSVNVAPLDSLGFRSKPEVVFEKVPIQPFPRMTWRKTVQAAPCAWTQRYVKSVILAGSVATNTKVFINHHLLRIVSTQL